MSKKMCLILCIGLFATDSFATTDIASNATTSTCDSGVLGATQGDVNFDAKWESNNVKLIWHDNNTVMQGLAAASNTCDYDGTLTIPATEPQRVGYTFAGWHVMPTVDASTLTALTTGTERWMRTYYNNHQYYWHASGTASATEVPRGDYAEFNELNVNEWKVDYGNGTLKGSLYGTSYCSAKSGNHHDGSWSTATSSDWLATHAELEQGTTTSNSRYCWCQATGWMAEGSSTLQALSSLSSASSQVFSHDNSSADSCANDCAAYCAPYALNVSAFRRALFVGTGN